MSNPRTKGLPLRLAGWRTERRDVFLPEALALCTFPHERLRCFFFPHLCGIFSKKLLTEIGERPVLEKMVDCAILSVAKNIEADEHVLLLVCEAVPAIHRSKRGP